MQKQYIALKNTVKALDKKNNQGDKHKYDNKKSNSDNRTSKKPVMYCHSCGRTNDSLNISTNFLNPKTCHKWHAIFRRVYGGLGVNYSKAWNGGPKNTVMCSNVANNISKQKYAQIIQSSTVAPPKTITTHPDTGSSYWYKTLCYYRGNCIEILLRINKSRQHREVVF